MSVSVSMPQLGESVTEGTVTRWLKKEGERVEVDEPLLEVSTDKVDTEIPSPASGILRAIAVDEDETVAVGAQLAVIEDSEESGLRSPRPSDPRRRTRPSRHRMTRPAVPRPWPPAVPASTGRSEPAGRLPRSRPRAGRRRPGYAPPPACGQAPGHYTAALRRLRPARARVAASRPPAAQECRGPGTPQPRRAAPPGAGCGGPAEPRPPPGGPCSTSRRRPGVGEAPYVTPLVRKLASEHAVNLEAGHRDRRGRADPQAGRRGCRPHPARGPGGPGEPGRGGRSAARRRPGGCAPAAASLPLRARARPWRRPRCVARPSGCPGPAR